MLKLGYKINWGLGIGDWANPQSPIPNPQKTDLSLLK